MLAVIVAVSATSNWAAVGHFFATLTALAWARRYALATTLPIEVRPFQGEAED